MREFHSTGAPTLWYTSIVQQKQMTNYTRFCIAQLIETVTFCTQQNNNSNNNYNNNNNNK